jgi:hypothetical protein
MPGIYGFLKDMNRFGPVVNAELRKGSIAIAKMLVTKAKQNARTIQELRVATGLYAKPDRVPTIRVSNSRGFVSKSRPNARRSARAKAKIIDVWFGTEFGGGKYGKGEKTPARSYADGRTFGGGYTTQFRPHKGRDGYFFFPTVRSNSKLIDAEYGRAVDRALRIARVEQKKATVIDIGLRGTGLR